MGEKVDEETFVSSGVKGETPLVLSPPLGERGGHPHIYPSGFTTTYDRDFLQTEKYYTSYGSLKQFNPVGDLPPAPAHDSL